MFGIDFNGHPDLRNMYLPTEFEGFPLRKDFPLLARIVKPWPGIVDVEPMPTEEEAATARQAGPESDAGRPSRDGRRARRRHRRNGRGRAGHPEFVSGKGPGTDDSTDANEPTGSASANTTDTVALADTEAEDEPS